ncbi:hypothetical protein H0H81_005070 [Sphagnurus paluster]|uniref:Uncharacterized protein n=1 Tax=Sphagnurus paluster TaxID=117069 RepID=A0A9P7GT16_9AGAR|nr:hypothetical protein H0H81_005070 [Sphagnurus paluster]
MTEGLAVASVYAQRSLFDGIVIATLGYGMKFTPILCLFMVVEAGFLGALLMLSIQLVQVLISRPKWGNSYYTIIGYFMVLFVLATVAIGGKLKYAELTFVDHRDYPGGPVGYFSSHLNDPVYIMCQVWYVLDLFALLHPSNSFAAPLLYPGSATF